MNDELTKAVNDQGRGSVEETARSLIADRLAAFRERWDALNYRDSESVKRMRVASRRLQAAMDAFAPFYKHRKRVKGVRAYLKSMTAALGEARDAAMLQIRLREWLGPLIDTMAETMAELRERELEALEYLSTVAGHDGKERLVHISDMLLDGKINRTATEGRAIQGNPTDEIGTTCLPLIRYHLAQVTKARNEAAADPTPEPLHDLRIAVKKLRYTLELFSYFLPPADATLKVLRDVQTLLGDIHDADVLLTLLPPSNPAQAALQERRVGLFKNYLDYMTRLEQSGRWQRIEAVWANVLSQQPTATEAELERSGGVLVEDWPHARQTERLALAIYDQLAPLHEPDADERKILGLAAFLHNAGMLVEASEHHKHSYRIIRKAKLRGFNSQQTEEVALVARYHRRALPDLDRHTEFAALDEAGRARVERLAAIIRIADALDYEHCGEVATVAIAIDERTVLLTVSGEADLSSDVERARAKADLFPRAFGRAIEIVADGVPDAATVQLEADDEPAIVGARTVELEHDAASQPVAAALATDPDESMAQEEEPKEVVMAQVAEADLAPADEQATAAAAEANLAVVTVELPVSDPPTSNGKVVRPRRRSVTTTNPTDTNVERSAEPPADRAPSTRPRSRRKVAATPTIAAEAEAHNN